MLGLFAAHKEIIPHMSAGWRHLSGRRTRNPTSKPLVPAALNAVQQTSERGAYGTLSLQYFGRRQLRACG